MNNKYDALVIGGGHNGLTTAAYLAKAGKKVLVLERRHVLGGAAVTEEIYPGFKYSVCSYVVSLLRPEVIRELELPKYDLEIIPLDSTFTPLPDGNLVSSKGGHPFSGIGSRGDSSPDGSGVKARQTGIVFRERVRLVLQPAALDQGEHPPGDERRHCQDFGILWPRQFVEFGTSIRSSGAG